MAPYGVDLLQNRLINGRERFKKNKVYSYNPKLDKFDELVKYIEKIEDQIFGHCNIQATRINIFKNF